MRHATEAETIEAEIRSTQSRIDATVDAIKRQLSPSELLDQGVAYLKAHGGDIGRTASRKIAENPLPLALMASAVAWMMIADGRSKTPAAASEADRNWNIAPVFSTHREAMSLHDRVNKAGAEVTQGTNEPWDSFMGRLHDVRGAAMGLARHAGEDIAAFRERVSSAFADLTARASNARETMRDHFAALREDTATATQSAKTFAGDATNQIGAKAQDLFKEQPLVVGALGVALGALAGVLIPKIKGEEAVLGGAGESIRKTAADLAEEVKHRVENAAEHIGYAVANAAREEGLTVTSAKEAVSGIVEKAERFAERTIEAAKDEADRTLRNEEHR